MVGRSLRIGLTAFCCVALAAPSSALPPVCFKETEKPQFPVIMYAPPPIADGGYYPFYPADFAATMQFDRIVRSKSSKVKGIYWQWANHGPRRIDKGKKGNITFNSLKVQIRFSSNAAANDCTMAQTAVVTGQDPKPYLERGKLTPTTDGQTADTLDVCILQKAALPAETPVLLDYEVADERTVDETRAFLLEWARFVKASGRSTILITNALDAPSQKWTQVTAENAPEIAKAFDKVVIALHIQVKNKDIAASFERQERMYATTPDKIVVSFELRQTSLQDAKFVHGLMTSGKASWLGFSRNLAKQGGECDTDTNKKIACAAFGRCP